MTHPGQSGVFCLSLKYEVCEGRACHGGRCHTRTNIATGPAERGSSVEPHRSCPVTGNAEHTRPSVRDRDLFCGGEKSDKCLTQTRDSFYLGRTVFIGSGPKSVGISPPSKCDAIIECALRIHVHVRKVSESLAAFPSDRIPLRIGKGFGNAERGIHRQPGTVLVSQVCREALGCTDDDLGCDRPRIGPGLVRSNLTDRRWLVDCDTERFDRLREPPHKFRRMYPGAVRMPCPTKGTRNTDSFLGFICGKFNKTTLAPQPLRGR